MVRLLPIAAALALCIACAGDGKDDDTGASGPADLVLEELVISSDSNGDGVPSANETVYLKPSIRNRGGEDVYNASIVVSTDDPFLTIATTSVSASFTGGSVTTTSSSFQLEVAEDVPDNHDVDLIISIDDDDGNSFEIDAVLEIRPTGAQLAVAGFDMSSTTNGDPTANPGETVYIKPLVENIGTSRADQVMVVYTTDDPDVTINTTSAVSYPAIEPGDAAQNSSSVGLDLASGMATGDVVIDAAMVDMLGNTWTDSFELEVVEPLSDLVFHHYEVTSDDGGDQIPDAGETFYVRVHIENIGTARADSVMGVLSTSSPFLTIEDPDNSYSTIEPAEIEDGSSSYRMSWAGNTPAGHSAAVFVNLSDGLGTQYADSFAIVEGAGAIVIVYDDHDLDEHSGDGDNRVETNETWNLDVALANVGSNTSGSVSASMSTSDANILVTDGNASWGTIGAGASADSGNDLQFTVLGAHPGGTVTFDLDIDAGALGFSDSFQVTVE